MNGGNIRIVRKRAKIRFDTAKHMRERDFDLLRRRGIGGAHVKAVFDRLLAAEGGIVTNWTPHPDLNRVTQIECQIPALDAKGNPTGIMKQEVFKKTVYDSSILSESDVLEWVLKLLTTH
jgi:hypothetical protein